MAALKAGDCVTVVSREVTPDDAQKGLYYSYFGGLVGTVDRVYDDGSVCVDIDLDSLTADMRDRHLEIQEAERKRWLENLSGELRNRLTPEQRQLRMSYKILVSKKDLEPCKGGKPRRAVASSETTAAESDDSAAPAGPSHRSAVRGPSRQPKASQPQPKRLSESELSAKEEEYLRSLQDRQ